MEPTTTPNKGGRPRLPDPVKRRSVKLSDADWEWLRAQDQGASATIRELIAQARSGLPAPGPDNEAKS